MANKIYEENLEFMKEAGYLEHLYNEDGPWYIPTSEYTRYPMSPRAFQQLMWIPQEDLPRMLQEIQNNPDKNYLKVPYRANKDSEGSKSYCEAYIGNAYNAALHVLRKRLELGR